MKLITVNHYQAHVILVTLERSPGQRSRSTRHGQKILWTW